MQFQTFYNLCAVIGALVVFTAAPVTYAQNATPDVEVDWSALEALDNAGPPDNAQTQAQKPLIRPVQRSWKPSLTRQPQSFPVQTSTRSESSNPALPPSKPVTASAPAPVSIPIPVPVSAPITKLVAKPAAVAVPVAKPAAPVAPRTIVRTDTGPMLPLPSEITASRQNNSKKIKATEQVTKKTIKKTALANIPVPQRKPKVAQAVKTASLQTTTQTKKPPLPKHRPNIQKASASFVTQARRSLKALGELSALAKQEGPIVPALPPIPVATETLPKTTDSLARQITMPSKIDLVKAIETISNHLPATPPKAGKQNKLAQIASRKLRKPKWLQKPDKPSPIDITADVTTDTNIAKNKITAPDITELSTIAPAAGDASGKRLKNVPRPPPQEKHEEEYISLKFAPGVNTPDKDIQSRLQNDILGLLQGNPDWRVQIQAFASPNGEGVSSARRISLSRALAIRTWLMDQGIDAARMDVRALGAESNRQPLDRVDMVFFDPKNG